jgi:hypothetical protein
MVQQNRTFSNQLYVKAMFVGVRAEQDILEIDPCMRDGIPRLEGALLRAEQQAVPGGTVFAGSA